jgi:hypothetical protein
VLVAALAAALAVASFAGAAGSSRSAVNPPPAPAVAAFFATVQGNEEDGTKLPAEQSFTTNFQRPVLRHFETGAYGLQIHSLGDGDGAAPDPGFVHARIVGPDGSCMSDNVADVNDGGPGDALFIGVQCFDVNGNHADRPFTVSYTRGGAQTGQLVAARVDPNPKPDASGAIAPRFQESTVGGLVTVTSVAHGSYTFNLPALDAPGPGTIAVSPMAGLNGHASPEVACSILGTALISNGAVKQVKVSCRRSGDSQPASAGEAIDPGVAITYVKGTNLLGVKTLSSAYFNMPKTTAAVTVLGPDRVRNQIFGQVGGSVTVIRKQAGVYQVDLPNQQGGFPPETTIVTASGGNAACRPNRSITIPGNESDAQTLIVKCKDFADQPVDSGFQLQYSVHQ